MASPDSGFFADVNGDREYDMDFLAEYIGSFISNGVYNGELAVTTGGNMNIIIPAGRAWNGPGNKRYYKRIPADIAIAVSNADGVLNRKDTVVLRWDINARDIISQVLTGTPASNPVAPAIVRTAEQYDLKLAEISIPAGTTAITQALITDTRLDNSVCGIVTGVVHQVDTTALYNQIQSDLANFKSGSETGFATWSDQQKAAFNTWLDGIKQALNADTAGNLLNLINSHEADKSNPHGVTAEQTGAVKGNTASWIATSVVSSDAWSQLLTIPNFVFSEGCKVTFKTVQLAKDDSTPDGTRIIINGKGYCLLSPKREILPSDSWVVGATITVTLSNDPPIGWGAANNCGTAFFKSGGSYGTLAAQIKNFYATFGDASIALSWTNPQDSNFSGVAIVRKTGEYPSQVLDGVKIYEGSGISFTDTGLVDGTQYFYRAFAYNSKHEYQTEYCVATMTPIHEYQLGALPIGAKIKFGSIFGDPIIMKIANKSGSDITLISDGTIARYAFDAKEPLNSNNICQVDGNNRYALSNIHQWLNSEAGAGSWYAAQHGEDQPPDSKSVVSANPYDSMPGFLNGFSAKEKSLLKTKPVVAHIANADGGGGDEIEARVWLPSGTEVGLSTEYTEGSLLSGFSNNNSRIAYETVDCAAHCGGTAGAAQQYWLRTLYGTFVRIINDTGGGISFYPADGSIGVRPLCVLDSSVLLSLEPDASGVYTVL